MKNSRLLGAVIYSALIFSSSTLQAATTLTRIAIITSIHWAEAQMIGVRNGFFCKALVLLTHGTLI